MKQLFEWINARKRLPKDSGQYDEPDEFLLRVAGDDPRSGWVSVSYETADQLKGLVEQADGAAEWLDEYTVSMEAVQENLAQSGEELNPLLLLESVIRVIELTEHKVGLQSLKELRYMFLCQVKQPQDESLKQHNLKLTECLGELVAAEEKIYQQAKDSADWFNNNTDNIGITIPYATYPSMPGWVRTAQELLNIKK